MVAAASQVFSLLMADPGLVGRIEENTKHFRQVELGCFLLYYYVGGVCRQCHLLGSP